MFAEFSEEGTYKMEKMGHLSRLDQQFPFRLRPCVLIVLLLFPVSKVTFFLARIIVQIESVINIEQENSI